MSCVLCGNEKLNKEYEPPAAAGRALMRCAACGLLQISPLPTIAELAEYYQKYDILGEREPYYQKLWGPDAIETPEGQDVRSRFDWAKNLCKTFGKTLDVGSGPGLFLRLVKNDGGEAIGSELNTRAAEKSASQIGVTVHAGTIADIEEGNFDTIALWDLLEHVNNPKQLISDCRSRLKPGGWLFIETPDESSLLDRIVLGLAKMKIGGPAATFYGLHHLVLFRRPTITKLLESNGFKIIEIRGDETVVGRIFRGSGLKDRVMRFGVGFIFLIGRLIGKQNKMLVAAQKIKLIA